MKTNAQIQKDVIEELKWEPLLTAAEIGVAVKDGIVSLSGTVDSYAKKINAEKAALRVTGVKAVAEDIVVKQVGDGKKTDAELAGAILNALKWHSSIDENKLKFKVEDGWVRVEGNVDWEYQKSAVASTIANLSGVVGVTNLIKITPHIETSDVKNQISRALHRSATIDSNQIHVQASGHKVVLTGTVRSFAEKEDAEKASWRAPGVQVVENLISVEPEVYA